MRTPEVIVFDVDGVLVDVGASYRETIIETVRHFTGETISNDLIQDFKNQGGWNNDWDLTHRLVTDRGRDIPYDRVVQQFDRIFLGTNGDGLILREEWLPRPELLDDLRARCPLAIFTGRFRYELEPTLRRFQAVQYFDPAVTADDVARQKPAPDGLFAIQKVYPGKHIWYLGDTVDDARAAAEAKVSFIGIAAPHSPRRSELVSLLNKWGAIAVLNNINELQEVLASANAKASV